MTKRLSLILMLLLIGFMSEAKVTSTKDEVNVASVHAGTQNAVEPRHESISADITGNTLTITFNAILEEERESMSHKVNVYYAVREWRVKGQEEEEYPVDIEPSN